MRLSDRLHMRQALNTQLKFFTILICIGVLTLAASSPAQAQDAAATDGKESLFNGENLEGWEGKEQFWSVRDGAITGQTTPENPTSGNTFLIYRGNDLADFELTLKFRIVGGNSGIQYRSQELDDFVVSGYQADIDSGPTFIGILYEERGRGILARRTQEVWIGEDGSKKVEETPTCDEEEMLASIQEEDWNEYRIVASGGRLTQFINGFKTIEVIDHETDKAARSGVLALQLHQGPPMLVQFKDIELERK